MIGKKNNPIQRFSFTSYHRIRTQQWTIYIKYRELFSREHTDSRLSTNSLSISHFLSLITFGFYFRFRIRTFEAGARECAPRQNRTLQFRNPKFSLLRLRTQQRNSTRPQTSSVRSSFPRPNRKRIFLPTGKTIKFLEIYFQECKTPTPTYREALL